MGGTLQTFVGMESDAAAAAAAELVRRNIAPIKAAFLQRNGADVKAEATPAEAVAAAVPPLVDGAAEPKPSEAPKPGVRGDWVLGKERAAAVPGSAPQKKLSKKQAAAQRFASRSVQLCSSFVQGRCAFGDGCRFSHDVSAFLASKPADLPGACPFASQPACPYGVACRYARSHSPPDAAVAAWLASEPGSAADSAGAPADAETVVLPAVDAVLPERNCVTPSLQAQLRKNQRRFPEADALLEKLGCKISFRPPRDAPAESEDGAEADGAVAKRARLEEAARGCGARVRPGEVKLVDFSGKLYLAPLTTVGNLPFRRVAKWLGADVTCSEMALATSLLQGSPSEWALLRRHPSEDLFGVQLCGGYPDAVARACQLLGETVDFDFLDLNCGCPIDLVCDKGAGAALLRYPARMEKLCRAASGLLGVPLTLKTRTGWEDAAELRSAHSLAPRLRDWGVTALTLHGRTRAQRYSRTADWDYIAGVARGCSGGDGGAPLPLIGNGDVFSWCDYEQHVGEHGVATCMLARGALIKPWLFTEIKERRHWDISAGERLDLLRRFASHGLEHWGSDGAPPLQSLPSQPSPPLSLPSAGRGEHPPLPARVVLLPAPLHPRGPARGSAAAARLAAAGLYGPQRPGDAHGLPRPARLGAAQQHRAGAAAGGLPLRAQAQEQRVGEQRGGCGGARRGGERAGLNETVVRSDIIGRFLRFFRPARVAQQPTAAGTLSPTPPSEVPS